MAEDRTGKLKREIDEINEKIKKINTGRGKWFSSDHQDFIKIYNKCRGNDKKILAEGVKILGMKNTEIMDHLEVY
jgi:O-glycosyl hydrolase